MKYKITELIIFIGKFISAPNKFEFIKVEHSIEFSSCPTEKKNT
jgi:hypothetical protein